MSGARGLKGYAILYLVFLYAPILLLPVFALNDATIISFPLKGFTTKWFAQMLEQPTLHTALANSLIIAVTSAVAATVLGLFAARATTRFSFPGQGGIMGLIMLPLVLPDILVGVSLLMVLLGVGVKLGLWTVMLGHTLVCTPFAIAILTASFQSLDRSRSAAAAR